MTKPHLKTGVHSTPKTLCKKKIQIMYLVYRMYITTLRPRRLSSWGSGFLLTKNRADQPGLSNVVQLRGVLPHIENGNKY